MSKLRNFMLMGTLVAVVVAALSLPALAQDGFVKGVNDRELLREGVEAAWDDHFEDYLEDQAEKPGSDFDEDLYKNFFEDYYRSVADFYGFGGDDYWDDDYRWDERWDEREATPAVSQSFEQQAESGDVNQSFNVSNSGDNSNQCAGIQAEAIEFRDSGVSITVSPNSFTSCEQQVNQAASASG